MIIAPSLLAADFLNLQNEVTMVNNSKAQWLHLDVMDGVFVPNISFGTPVIEQVCKLSTKVNDVHLMIVNPENYLQTFKNIGANVITVHQEACTHLHRCLSQIRSIGALSGVAINPSTPVGMLSEILHLADVVCVMSVNPGFGGQSFIPETFEKVRQLRQLITQKGCSTKIEIDGGVSQKNAKQLFDAGADILVAGNSVFKADNPTAEIEAMFS